MSLPRGVTGRTQPALVRIGTVTRPISTAPAGMFRGSVQTAGLAGAGLHRACGGGGGVQVAAGRAQAHRDDTDHGQRRHRQHADEDTHRDHAVGRVFSMTLKDGRSGSS